MSDPHHPDKAYQALRQVSGYFTLLLLVLLAAVAGALTLVATLVPPYDPHAALPLIGSGTIPTDQMRGNIENPIGTVQMPVAVTGPLRVRGEQVVQDNLQAIRRGYAEVFEIPAAVIAGEPVSAARA